MLSAVTSVLVAPALASGPPLAPERRRPPGLTLAIGALAVTTTLTAQAQAAPVPTDSSASAERPVPADSSAPAGQPVPEDSSAPAEQPVPEDSSPAPEPVPEDRAARAIEGPTDGAMADDTPDDTPAVAPADGPAPASEKPPRVDGTYFGGTLGFGLSFARVNNFPTPDAFVGGGGSLRVGEVVYPWMSIGIEVAGNLGYRSEDPRQRLLKGAFLVDFGFYPKPSLPLSLRVGFGAGGGAVRERGIEARSGFGGAVFTGAVRYEFFPGAAVRRPKRGGGLAIGPELGWVGFLPAAKGRPMANTIYLGLFLGFYFGS